MFYSILLRELEKSKDVQFIKEELLVLLNRKILFKKESNYCDKIGKKHLSINS